VSIVQEDQESLPRGKAAGFLGLRAKEGILTKLSHKLIFNLGIFKEIFLYKFQ